VTNGIPVSCPLFLPVRTANCVAALKAGAGSADVNGKYVKTSNMSSDSMPVFQKDDTHQLYRYDGVWKLAQEGQTVYYQATDNVPNDLVGPPTTGWVVYGGAKKFPAPTSVTCASTGPPPPIAKPCSCVHAVACAACHPTAAEGQTYYAGTSVEMTQCDARCAFSDRILHGAIGSHACSLEANMRVTNGIPLGSPLHLPVPP
jgi:hypothetical protein